MTILKLLEISIEWFLVFHLIGHDDSDYRTFVLVAVMTVMRQMMHYVSGLQTFLLVIVMTVMTIIICDSNDV